MKRIRTLMVRAVFSYSMSVPEEQYTKRTRPLVHVMLIVIVVSIAAVFCFYNLGGRSISRADESLYARSVQEMLDSHSWIPTLHGSPFLHKPPLVQLLMSLAVAVCGDATWVYRIPTALAGFIYVILIPFFAYRLFRSLAVVAFSFVAILSCKMLFFSHLIREAVPDGLLILFLLLGLICGWELWRELLRSSVHSRKALVLEVLFGTTVLLALFAKSVAGLMSLIIWWVWMLGYGRSALRPIRRLIAIGIFTTLLPIAIFTAGYLVILNAVPGTFGAAVHYEVIEKLVGEGHHNTSAPYYYVSQLFVNGRAFPAFVLVLALSLGLVRAVRGDARCAYLSIAVFVPLVGYSFLHSRLYWYIAPVFAPCAVLIGFLVDACLKRDRFLENNRVSRFATLLGGAIVLVLLGLHIFHVVKEQLMGDRRTKLETRVQELLARKVSNPNMQIVLLCIDPADQYFKSLLLREWFYLDMLKPYASSVCTAGQVQEILETPGPKIVVTAPHREGLLPQTAHVLERVSIKVDRWKGISKPNRVRELVFFQINPAPSIVESN